MQFLKSLFVVTAFFLLSFLSPLLGFPELESVREGVPRMAEGNRNAERGGSVEGIAIPEEDFFTAEANHENNILRGENRELLFQDGYISSDSEEDDSPDRGIGIPAVNDTTTLSSQSDDPRSMSPQGMKYYELAKRYLALSEAPGHEYNRSKWRSAAQQIVLAGENQFAHDQYKNNQGYLIRTPLLYQDFYQEIAELHKDAASALVQAITIGSSVDPEVIVNLKQASANFKNGALCKAYAGKLKQDDILYHIANDSARLYRKAGDCAREAANVYSTDPVIAGYWKEAEGYFKQGIIAINEINNQKAALELSNDEQKKMLVIGFCAKKMTCYQDLGSMYQHLALNKREKNDDMLLRKKRLEDEVAALSRSINITLYGTPQRRLQRGEAVYGSYEEPCLLKEVIAFSEERNAFIEY